MTLLDTPEGKAAIAAVVPHLKAIGDWGNARENAVDVLTAALPHLRRALASELRAANPYVRVTQADQAEFGWNVAADHLARGER